ncbi:MAG: hypothetical protein DI629_12230 [Mesorhizobium amorphae]|nr:MAG: hypothetical protein DI629_12230 [Mesorhizobium amorphae]
MFALIDSIVRRHVGPIIDKTVAQTVEEEVPRLVREALERVFLKQPNAPLTKDGFAWAIVIEMQKHWPDVPGPTAVRWIMDEIGVPFGAVGHGWSAADAQDLVREYISAYGEEKANG